MNVASIQRRNDADGSERLQLSISAARIPAIASATLQQVATLLDRANSLVAEAQREAESIRAAAHAQGLEEGRRAAASELAQQLVLAQSEVRDFIAGSESRVVRLATAIVRRILGSLELDQRVPELAAEAAATLQAERYLTLRVHPQAVAAVESQLDRLRQMQPAVERLQVVGDAALGRLDCIAESELGVVRASFSEQLERIEDALLRTAAEPLP